MDEPQTPPLHIDEKFEERLRYLRRIAALESELAQAHAKTRHAERSLSMSEADLAKVRAERDTAREELRNLGDRYEERVRERDEARAERDHWMRLWLKPEPDAARKEGT